MNNKTVDTKRVLPVLLTAAEKNERADEMAKTIEEVEKLKEQKKSLTAGLNEDIKEKNGIVRNLARTVASGYEKRTVLCEEQWNYAMRSIQTVRLDTGEIVDERTMTDEDRQEKLIREAKGNPRAVPEEGQKKKKAKVGDPLAGMEEEKPAQAKEGDALADMDSEGPAFQAGAGDPLGGME